MSNQEEIVLRKPTVADIIKLLSSLPGDAPLRIEDADTYWEISVIHVKVTDGVVWMSGQYHEMNG